MNDFLLIDEMFISSFLNYLDPHESINLTLLNYPNYEGCYWRVSGLSDSFIQMIMREADYMLADFGEVKVNRKVLRFLSNGYKLSAIQSVRMYKGWSLKQSKEWVDEIQLNCISEPPHTSVISKEVGSLRKEYIDWSNNNKYEKIKD